MQLRQGFDLGSTLDRAVGRNCGGLSRISASGRAARQLTSPKAVKNIFDYFSSFL